MEVVKRGGGEGLPNEIRKSCQDLREDDKEPAAEPFCYTTLVHLSRILDKQWPLFAKVLPDAVIIDKKRLLNEISRLNIIRNYVMHPVKGMPITEDDFIFVREFHKRIQRISWRPNAL